MNKPIWVCCGDKDMARKIKERLLDALSADCPHDPAYIGCLKEYGDVNCGDHGGCRKHWEQFVEFVDLEEESGEQE